METVDLRELRNRLPHGSIAKIAEKLNLSTTTVTFVFKGKRLEYQNAVLLVALEIIEGRHEAGKSALEKAKKLGLTTSEFSVPYGRRKKKVPAHQIRFVDLYRMKQEQIEAYLKDKNSKINQDDYSGVFISSHTAWIRFINALCDEQGIKKPTWDDLKKMNQNGLDKVAKELNPDYDRSYYPVSKDGENELRNDLANKLDLLE